MSGNAGWPDDMDAWLASVGQIVTDNAMVTVSGFDAEYWGITAVDQEAIASIIGLNGLSATDVIQSGGGQVYRIYRIETPGSPILGSAWGIDRALAPDGDLLPPFIPTPEMASLGPRL